MGALTIMPTASLGTKYYAITAVPDPNGFACQVTAVATQNKTTITITLPDGSSTTASVSSLQVRSFQGQSDLTGTLLTSNKPVAFITSCQCTKTPGWCGIEAQMTPPASTSQANFPLVPFNPNVPTDEVVIVASSNNTIITRDASPTTTLNAGQVYRFVMSSSYVGILTASKPVTISQLGNQEADAAVGIAVPIPSSKQFITGSCMFSTLVPSN